MDKPGDLIASDEQSEDSTGSEISIIPLGNAVSRTQGGNKSNNENKREIYS